ncbi:MAG: pseudouridine synthase [Nitrospinota bacterium]|nr:pseudouridine synthase [Nitrospinota bacterium]
MSLMRIQKIIAQAGIASRRRAEELIVNGSVTVNGRTIKTLGSKADPLIDSIKVNRKLITRREGLLYLVMNKPRSVLTTMSEDENESRLKITDFLPKNKARVFPVGRLDFDAKGTLILTNDGELANRLMHPKYEIQRVYMVKIEGIPKKKDLEKMATGTWVSLEKNKSGTQLTKSKTQFFLKSQIEILPKKTKKNSWLRIKLREGKNHQVKRMCEAVGHPIIQLNRYSYAGVTIKGLLPGKMRSMKPEEISRLRKLTNLET